MSAVMARIMTRYLAGGLLAWGLIDHGTAEAIALDPDLALVLAGLCAALTEGAYAFARRQGLPL